MKILLLALALIGVSCESGPPAMVQAKATAEQKWVVVDYYRISTLRNTVTGSCYVAMRSGVYGGHALALVPAKNNADCE